MSSDYKPLKEISACELFDGKLEKFGIHEHVMSSGETNETQRCLTDGCNVHLGLY